MSNHWDAHQSQNGSAESLILPVRKEVAHVSSERSIADLRQKSEVTSLYVVDLAAYLDAVQWANTQSVYPTWFLHEICVETVSVSNVSLILFHTTNLYIHFGKIGVV